MFKEKSSLITFQQEIPSLIIKKSCTKCGIEKKLDQYHRARKEKDGRQYQCKICVKKWMSEYYQRNKNLRLKQNRNWSLKNKDKIRNYSKKWWLANKERLSPIRKIYAKEHKIEAALAARKHYLQHRDSVLERMRIYKKENLDMYRACWIRRRAKKRMANGKIFANDLYKIRQKQNNKCYYCNLDVGLVGEFDHVIPISRGGQNIPINLVLACMSCNRSKGSKLPDEFIKFNSVIANV